MKSKWSRLSGAIKGIFFVLISVYLLLLIALNLWLPLGMHVAIAISNYQREERDTKRFFFDLFVWRSISRIVVATDSQKCDLPNFQLSSDGTAAFFQAGLEGKDERLTFLITSAGRQNTDATMVDKLLDETLLACNANGAHSDPTGHSPLSAAIATKNYKTVSRLLDGGADALRRIRREDKPYNGMDSYEFARYLQGNAKSAQAQRDYAQIADLIDARNKSKIVGPPNR
jgi:hypothetical protein